MRTIREDRPESVQRLFDYARERDCDYILFDRDAEPVEGFETFRPYCDECEDKGCSHCDDDIPSEDAKEACRLYEETSDERLRTVL